MGLEMSVITITLLRHRYYVSRFGNCAMTLSTETSLNSNLRGVRVYIPSPKISLISLDLLEI